MRCIIISCLFITILPVMLLSDETEIEVLQGKVRGRTPQTEMMISAGQKGLIKEGQEPIIAVNDPLVQQAIHMYRWIEEERKSGHSVEDATIAAMLVPIDGFLVLDVVLHAFVSIEVVGIDVGEQRHVGRETRIVEPLKLPTREFQDNRVLFPDLFEKRERSQSHEIPGQEYPRPGAGKDPMDENG